MRPTPPDPGFVLPSTLEIGFGPVAGPPSGSLLAGRYRIEGELGSGAFGVVRSAFDTVLRTQVAVKLLRPQCEIDRARFRRELAALRLLDLPGVVRWIDAGEVEGQVFVVTELVHGQPFPGIGQPCRWEDLAPVAFALLEVLARIHKAGVVHRDLKPANVLVDAHGRLTVLDFGLAIGRAIGEPVTGAGAVGTPGYLAPEQVLGHRADARSDLYAAGAMIFQALAGRLPLPVRDPMGLITVALAEAAPGLASAAVGVPRTVARVVDRLLLNDPNLRYASAEAVLSDFAGTAPEPGVSGTVPWLGDPALVETAVQRLLAGTKVDLFGPPGSGRQWCLRQVASRLSAAGRSVVWTARSREPFASLCDLGPPSAVARELDLSLAALCERVTDNVRRALDQGTVVLCGDWERIDPLSAKVLRACIGSGGVLRVVGQAERADLVLQPVAEEALRELFHGPDQVLHLREDAACLLYGRTRGWAGRVVRELESWLRAGTAEWRDGKIAVRRADLDRLQAALPLSLEGGVQLDVEPRSGYASSGGAAGHPISSPVPSAVVTAALALPHLNDLLAWVHVAWPAASAGVLARAMGQPLWRVEAELLELEALGGVAQLDGKLVPRWPIRRAWSNEQLRAAHAALAKVLPPGSERRLHHLVVAGRMADAAEEARTVALGLLRDGRVGDATALLQLALPSVRELVDGAAEAAMLDALLRVALAADQVEALDAWLYEYDRATRVATRRLGGAVLSLARAVAAVMRARTEATWREILAVPELGDVTLDAARWHYRTYAARAMGPEAVAEQLAGLEAWTAAVDHPLAHAVVDKCRGWTFYHQGRYRDAADCHARGADREIPLHTRMALLLDAASARLETGEHAESLAVARRAVELAGSRRLAATEARARWLVRANLYRMGTVDGPDLELCAAVAAIGHPVIDMVVALGEAAFAWRCGQEPLARKLAGRSARIAEQVNAQAALVIAKLTAAAAGAVLSDCERAACLAFCEACPDAAMRLQLAALCAMSGPVPAGLGARVRQAALAAGVDLTSDARLDVLSPAEANRLLFTMTAVGGVSGDH